MSTVYYPAAFATEAARNLRHLAADDELQTTGPGTTALLGDLRDAATAMREVIDRIAAAHTLPGAPALARDTGLQIGDELHQAGTALEETTTRLTGAVTAIEHPTTVPTQATRRSLRADRQARVAQPAGSWFDPHPAGSSTGQGRGLGL
ncbi:hypothetical protein AB0333_07720 [Citricoccus sp. NPDC079358]|uniref:hypothetical protein n=1 Tax=Micrococcaceae TaxID=1268 RepID=UPI0007502F25|nr:hypothetical protein [Kocuria rhizophila]KUP28355.1 hypothetical protein IX41_02470 [Kocuria rhizophila]